MKLPGAVKMYLRKFEPRLCTFVDTSVPNHQIKR